MTGRSRLSCALVRRLSCVPQPEICSCTGHRPPGVLFARVVRFMIAAILLSSAVLKTHQLATEPLLGSGLLQSRWLLALVVEYECFLACWLISGLYPEVAWRVSFATFGVFAVVVTGKGIVGETSCGCFGRLPTSPWLALSIDLVAVVLLWSVRSSAGREVSPLPSCDEMGAYVPNPRRPVGHVAGSVLCVWLVVAIGCGVAIASSRSGVAEAIGQRIGNTVVIEPERMVGRPFALGRYIDIGERLARGRWLVVFYRPGCADCERLMKRWGELDLESVPLAGTAFVSVTGTARLGNGLDGHETLGGLSPEWEWFAPTPFIVVLCENRVLASRTVTRPKEAALFVHDTEIPAS